MAIKVIKTKPEFVDERGFISRIVNNSKFPIKSVLYIERKAGTVSANHFHKKDAHYIYCIKGKIKYYEKDMRKKGKLSFVILTPGDLVLSKPMIAHATEFLEDTVFFAFAAETRNHKAYEDDTVRVKLV